MSFSSRTAPHPPAQIRDVDDVEHLRSWAFSALADGRGREVIAALEHLDPDATPGPAWADVWTELHVRTGIAIDDANLVLCAATELAAGGVAHLAPPVLLTIGLGAAWLVEDGARQNGPASRFDDSRHWLRAARWTLASVLSRGGLDESSLEEGTTALDQLYRSAWRMRDVVWPLDDFETASSVGVLWEALEQSLDAPPAAQDACASGVLHALVEAIGMDAPPAEELDELEEVEDLDGPWGSGPGAEDATGSWIDTPVWTAGGRTWWFSAMFGMVLDVSPPATAAECHRFALADVLMELEELAEMPLSVDDPLGQELFARHRHELARHAVAHAAGMNLIDDLEP